MTPTGDGLGGVVQLALSVLVVAMILVLGGQVAEQMTNQLNVSSSHPLHSTYNTIINNNFNALRTTSDFLVIVVLVVLAVMVITTLLKSFA